jgi:hypothetical protein
MPTALSDERKSSAKRYLTVPETYVSSLRKQGCRRSVALRPTWVRLWHISSRPTPHSRLTQPWLTFESPRPWWREECDNKVRCVDVKPAFAQSI